MTSRVNDAFSPNENGGGFLGGLFTNMVIYNPTFPVKRTDGSYYEAGLRSAPAATTHATVPRTFANSGGPGEPTPG